MTNIKVILGSTRQGRFGIHIANWLMQVIKERDDMTAELIDLREYPMPFYEETIRPYQVQNGGYGNKIVREFAAKIAEADGIIIVSPEYNHSIPAVLKNALDNIYVEWKKKPLSIVTYGGVSAGARAAEHLYQIAVILQMVPLSNAVLIPLRSLLDETFNFKDGSLEQFKMGSQAMLTELAWWAILLDSTKEKITKGGEMK